MSTQFLWFSYFLNEFSQKKKPCILEVGKSMKLNDISASKSVMYIEDDDALF